MGNDTRLCPSERTALSFFYTAAKGREWTVSENWMSQYKSHCSWHGVDCSKTNKTVKLNLTSNGLSVTLSKHIAILTSLSEFDLSDNDIKGNIPSEIGFLIHLKYLRLSYNTLKGKVPIELQNLIKLNFIQLNGNRLSGTIPPITDINLRPGESSFVADCGVPSTYEDPLACADCTICCNSLDNCYFKEE